MTTRTQPQQSRAARAAMLIQWAEHDRHWHTDSLISELVALVRDCIPADAIAVGAHENAARMLEMIDADPDLRLTPDSFAR